MKLKNKVALVTGSSSGIGKAIAVGFAKEGANVIVNYNKNRTGAKETVAKIISLGRRCLLIKANVGKKDEVDSMFNIIEKEFGMLDILVNNAGITPKIPFEEIIEEEWDKIQTTNLKSVFLCSQRALPFLKKSRGCILNISSIHAVKSTYNFSCYAASKGGMESLTRAMALELGEHGIRVNALRPGLIQVERDMILAEEQYRKMCERIPLRRAGKVEDTVPAAIFFCSEDSSYISGQILAIDGGHEVILNTAFPKGHVSGGAVSR
ncbi:MAG: 3-oxoacyl-ACP reductase family protein [bacterium]